MTSALLTVSQQYQASWAVYYNSGDWVESCTALAEHHDGGMEILCWAEAEPASKLATLRAVA